MPFDNGIDRFDWLSAEGRLTAMNNTASRALGTAIEQCRGRAWQELWSEDSRETIIGHVELARQKGTTRFTAASDSGGNRRWWDVVLSVTPTGFVAQARDTTALNAAIDDWHHRSTHDELTGLLNRAAFKDAVDTELNLRTAHGSLGALLMLDLDNFKLINDTMGHEVGDHTLKAVAQRMRDVFGDCDCSARLGGDEFAAIVPHIVDLGDLRAVLERLLERLAQPLDVDGQTISPRASIGVALFPKHGNTSAILLKNADIALYAAKSFDRGCYVVFVPAMGGALRRRASAVAAARAALSDGRVQAHYQPVIDFSSNSLIGFEAKIHISMVSAEAMAARDLRLIDDDVELAQSIGSRMFDLVTDDMRKWRDNGLVLPRIAINACAAEFRSNNYAERLLARIDEACLARELFDLEVAETVFACRGSHYVTTALKTLGSAGVSILLDDFGSGPASLTHLKRLPVSGIKIDRSFVEPVGNDYNDGAIVRAMVGLADGFRIGVSADGVSTIGQAYALKMFGCNVGQGSLFGDPEPADGAATRLKKHTN